MSVPLVVFAYNRPEHLQRTIHSLTYNKLLDKTVVYVFVDGPKNERDKHKINEIKKYLNEIKDQQKIPNIKIYYSEVNKGLANSIIYGVTKVINKHEKVLVIEDDVTTSEDFISFMDESLDYYKDKKNIFSIGGYSFLKEFPHDYNKDVFLTQRSSSYAWATWLDRWNLIDWDMKDYKNFRWNCIKRNSFNLWGNDRSSMLDDQMNGRISSWAIRFDYAMWKNKMFNILPCVSKCKSIGHDGSGTHCKNAGKDSVFQFELVQAVAPTILIDVGVNEEIRQSFIKPFKMSKLNLMKRFISNVLWEGKKDEHKK